MGLRIGAEVLAVKKENVDLETGLSFYLFPGSKGKPMHDIRTSFENACAEAQIKGKVIPHIVRHTFASRLAMKGVNNLTLQLLGRWEEPKMLPRCAHLSSE